MRNPPRDGVLPRARARRAGSRAAWIALGATRRASVGVCLLMILALCGVWSPRIARAAPRDGVRVGGYAQVVNSPILHLRAGPGLRYAIIVTMPQGAVVQVLDGPFGGDGYNWMKVSYGGTTGFAADRWLAPASAATSVSRSSLSSGSHAQVVNTVILHERSGPGLQYTIIVTMPQGAVVSIENGPYPADGYQWYQVSYTGTTGYAAGNWLAPGSGSSVSAPSGSSSSVSVTSNTSSSMMVGGYARVVNNSILHLRSGPGTNYSTIVTMPEGGIVQIEQGPQYGGAYAWWCVTYNGTRGYAAAPWLTPTTPPWS